MATLTHKNFSVQKCDLQSIVAAKIYMFTLKQVSMTCLHVVHELLCVAARFLRGERVQSMVDVLSKRDPSRKRILPVSDSMTSEALNSSFYPGI